jgi:glycosyltransferase involved in cell wall biosynthesis
MTLLFVTQKLHGQDAFGALWIKAFQDRGYTVRVICLEWRPEGMRAVLGTEVEGLEVHSLGKEQGASKIGQILRFWKLIRTLQYDRVFIHMAPVWGLLGSWKWIGKTPTYLWYTHYKMQAGLWLLGHYAKRMFCATPQSLPQYEGNPKKVVVGHGIDLEYWPKTKNTAKDPKHLLVVHRLSRSKRLELVLQALALLPGYTLDIYGMEAEGDYVKEMRELVNKLGLAECVHWKGSAPMKDLPAIYGAHHTILNMASETIDKTMLEAMTCGCYPITTKRNALAIGLRPDTDAQTGFAPSEDTPQAIAAFIKETSENVPMDGNDMYAVVKKRHSLESLAAAMDAYIAEGR